MTKENMKIYRDSNFTHTATVRGDTKIGWSNDSEVYFSWLQLNMAGTTIKIKRIEDTCRHYKWRDYTEGFPWMEHWLDNITEIEYADIEDEDANL